MCRRLSVLTRHVANHQGQVLILVAISSLVLIGFAALSVDFGYYSNERQRLQNALDAAALAGAQYLPLRASDAVEAKAMFDAAEAAAHNFAQINDDKFNLDDGDRLDVSYGCFVKAHEDQAGRADPIEIQTLCPQLEQEVEAFTCLTGRCFHDCPVSLAGTPDEALQRCNTIRVRGSKAVNLFLAPVVGAVGSTTVNLEGIACRGSDCGAPAEAAIVMMLDRSNSMNAAAGQDANGNSVTRLDQAKAGANSILNAEFLVSELHVVALATTPVTSNDAQDVLKSPLTPNYGELTNTVNSLETAHLTTDLHTPIRAATDLLTGPSAAGKDRILILLTDGAPSGSASPAGTPCEDATNAAVAAKTERIQIFTIFYGNPITENQTCPDPSSSQTAIELLANLASGSSDANPQCTGENKDGDNFSCAFDGEDLAPIFQRIIRRVTVGDGSSLIDLTGFI